jgi:beta-glucanase (GH16 family)
MYLKAIKALMIVFIGLLVLDACSDLPSGTTLAFDDEFNGASLDTTTWNALTGHSWGGPAYFTLRDVSESNGNLDLTTEHQYSHGYGYTTGMVTTEGKFSFLYGRVDIRARLPKGQGIWPAFWMLPPHASPAKYEIDIMEMLGSDPHTVYMTVWHQPEHLQCQFHGPDFSADYHIFSVVWTSSSVTWMVDGAQRCKVTSIIPNIPMMLLLDNWVGDTGSWPGHPDASTVFPQRLYIDYVRIYRDPRV